MALKKKLQDILRRTFNLMSTMALSMQKWKKSVVPRRGNENHFLATFSWFTLWPKMATVKHDSALANHNRLSRC